MKTIFLLLVSSFTMSSGFTQSLPEFAPVGATWYYHNIWMTPDFTFRKFVSVDDTVVGGKACKRINNGEDHYLYSDSLYLHCFNTEVNRWTILADFNKQVGDSFYVDVSTTQVQDSFAVVITKKGDTILNGYTLPYILVDNAWDMKSVTGNIYEYGGKIIQNIGSEIFLFPRAQVFDMDTYQLRCYDDDNLGLYKNPDFHNGLWSCDTVTTGIEQPVAITNLTVFPNPASENITFTFNPNLLSERWLVICDVYGRLVYSGYLTNGQNRLQLNIKEFKEGMYLYQLKSASTIFERGKFIVKR